MFNIEGMIKSGESFVETQTGGVAKTLVSGLITRFFGDSIELKDFSHDPQAGKMSLTLALKGETEPLKIDVGEYKVEHQDPDSFLVVNQATVSKPWLQSVVGFLLPQRIKFPLMNSLLSRPRRLRGWFSRCFEPGFRWLCLFCRL